MLYNQTEKVLLIFLQKLPHLRTTIDYLLTFVFMDTFCPVFLNFIELVVLQRQFYAKKMALHAGIL